MVCVLVVTWERCLSQPMEVFVCDSRDEGWQCLESTGKKSYVSIQLKINFGAMNSRIVLGKSKDKT